MWVGRESDMLDWMVLVVKGVTLEVCTWILLTMLPF